MKNKKQVARGGSSTSTTDMEDLKMDIKSVRKAIEFLGSTYMTCKEKKQLENKRVLSLGGKSMILGRFGSSHWRNSRKAVERHKPHDRVLKSSEGHFSNGVLNVKHLLQPLTSKAADDRKHAISKGKKKRGGKKIQGKKSGGIRHQ